MADDRVPTVDTIIHDTYKPVDDRQAFYRQFIDELQPGLTHLLFHCAKQSDELRAASGESSVWRDQDYRVFTDPDMKRYIEDSGAKLIGYRELKAHLQ